MAVAPAAAAATTRPGVAVVGCDQAASTIVLTTSAELDPSCTYSGGIQITRSHVTLDCQGAHVDQGDGRTGTGILVTTGVDVALHDITIRSCLVHGFQDGVRITRVGFRDLGEGHEYEHDYSRVHLVDDDISGAANVGVYVDGYVTGVGIDHVTVHDVGAVGVYLETGSKGTRILHSSIVGNGFADTDPAGTPVVIGGVTLRYVSTGREGIAIDGSQDNVIRDNVIRGNAYGGVLLYQNCGENHTTDRADWLPRRTAASGNLITDNTIADEPNGVWIASRMAENLILWDCSSAAFDTTGGAYHVLDHATANRVVHNTFVGDTYGVRVEDDGNHIVRNRFLDAPSPSGVAPPVQAVLVGTEFRTTALGEPVTGTVIRGNVSSLTEASLPYAVVWGDASTTFTGNRSRGAAVGALGAGAQPTINPFCMVLRVWLP
jgi:parallel beta-helix repeat protein